MSNTNNHVNVALCVPRDRTVAVEAYAEEGGDIPGGWRIHHAVHPVVAITATGFSNGISCDYLIHHPHFGLIGFASIGSRIVGAVYATLVCPGPADEDDKRIQAAVDQAVGRATANYKQLRNIP